MNALTQSTTSVSDYRFDHPRLADILHDMHIGATGAGPGDSVAPFRLDSLEGGALTSDALSGGSRPTHGHRQGGLK